MFTVAFIILIGASFFTSIANQTTGQFQTTGSVGFVTTAKSTYGFTTCNPCTATVTVTAGNWIVAYVLGQNFNEYGYTISDGQSNTYTSQTFSLQGVSFSTAKAGATGSNLITVTKGSAVLAPNGFMVVVYSGVNSIGAVQGCTGLSYPASGSFTFGPCSLTLLQTAGWLVGVSNLGCTASPCLTWTPNGSPVQSERQSDDAAVGGSNAGDFEDVAPLASSYSWTISMTRAASTGNAQTNGVIAALELDPTAGNRNMTSSPGLQATSLTLPLLGVGAVGLVSFQVMNRRKHGDGIL